MAGVSIAVVLLALFAAGATATANDIRADSVATTAPVDSTHTIAPIIVQARRPTAQSRLDRLPGAATIIEMAPLRDRITTTAEVLEQVPGLHVNDYGGLGSFSTVSIRGSGSSQVSVYLDGVPLARASLGVVNLADLPFAAIERIEVYRGFAPAELPGASIGGAINLVTRGAAPGGPASLSQSIVAGAGSFGTRRLGGSQEFSAGSWAGLVVADLMETDGNYSFYNDNATEHATNDDRISERQNNWQRNDEVLARLARALPHHGELRLVNQWVRREHGVAGLATLQTERTHGGAAWNLTSVDATVPALAGGRLTLRTRLDHEWRLDTFSDLTFPSGEVGLGMQDNRDVVRTLGMHAGARLIAPRRSRLTLDIDARRERLAISHPLPPAPAVPPQYRRTIDANIEEQLQLTGRLVLHAGLRANREANEFAGVPTVTNPHPPQSGTERRTEPHYGGRLHLVRGLYARGSWGRYHRTPAFFELFGDGGNVRGNGSLQPEIGTNRDFGLQWSGSRYGVDAQVEVTHFDNRVRHLIAFAPNSQRVLSASNIGAASMRGEEWSWHASGASSPRTAGNGDNDGADAGRVSAPRWSLDGSVTRLVGRDRGIDITWWAGNALLGRPANQLHQRVAVRAAHIELGYELDHLAENFLDRANVKLVGRRDLHSLDARVRWRGLGLQFGARNLTDERAADVAGFPLPGRTFFFSTSYKL